MNTFQAWVLKHYAPIFVVSIAVMCIVLSVLTYAVMSVVMK